MSNVTALEALTGGAILSPFSRLRALLKDVEPGHERPIEMTIGEPGEQMPPFVIGKLVEAGDQFAKYPPIRGTDALRESIAAWIARRYGAACKVDPAREILPVDGSREGLFYAMFPAASRKRVAGGRAAVLMPNPFYQTYVGSALAAGCGPVYLPSTVETGFLPDLDALAKETALLDRTAAFYLCSPSNPEGAIAPADYLAKAIGLARKHDFMLFSDECYSEIYSEAPPVGALEVAAGLGDGWRNIIIFNSLSKRSNLPGLRSGFVAGDGDFLDRLFEVRNLTGPTMPLPVQHASAAIWADEAHVVANRQAYALKFDIADEVIGTRYGYRRPGGGFFLWLDLNHLGGGIQAAVTLWKGCGVKVIPGAFLAQDGVDGSNPGQNYVRVALVHDAALIREALERIVSTAS